MNKDNKMDVEAEESTEEVYPVDRANTKDLIRSLRKGKDRYSFLIGAGTSKPAGIPTANDLIRRWKWEVYIEEETEMDVEELIYEEHQESVTTTQQYREWVAELDDNIPVDNNEYGYWFEKRYKTRYERREFIRDIVEENEGPTLGLITLASLMKEGYVPLTLTPNFDDLLYDAFYMFLEDKPLLVDHDAIAPEYRLTEERPTIIKLHGDYLYDNLKNTNRETAELEENIEHALSTSLDEYGLVVIGYGGNDDSIMNVLKKTEIPGYGLWWCTIDGSSVSDQVKELLKEPDTFLVEIEGSEEFFAKLRKQLDVALPTRKDIKKRAEERAEVFDVAIEDRKDAATGEEKEELEQLSVISRADKFFNEGEYDRAIETYSEAIELNPEDAWIYNNRGLAHKKIGNYNKAINDFTEAIRLDPDDGLLYYHRAETYDRVENYQKAITDYGKAVELGFETAEVYQKRSIDYLITDRPGRSTEDARKAHQLADSPQQTVVSLMLRIIPRLMEGDSPRELIEEFEASLSQDFTTERSFERIHKWLEKEDLENKRKIGDILSKVK